jgi:putative RNA 2'-phosphotransferase
MDSLQLSKFLSFGLRHRPDAIGISLDSQGWILVDELIAKSQADGTHFTREEL